MSDIRGLGDKYETGSYPYMDKEETVDRFNGLASNFASSRKASDTDSLPDKVVEMPSTTKPSQPEDKSLLVAGIMLLLAVTIVYFKLRI